MKRSQVPSYRRHKQSGQAVVTLPDGRGGRRDLLLGKHGTKASRLEYARVIAEWEAHGRHVPMPVASSDLSVNELLLAYWRFAGGYYVKNGRPTKQLHRVRQALKPVRALYGHTPAKDFSPLALKAVREEMLRQPITRRRKVLNQETGKREWQVTIVRYGLARKYINACVGCIVRVWKWGAENELVLGSVHDDLCKVSGLKKGRTSARETKKVRPAPDADVEATLLHLPRTVQAMVQVQRLTGMRPAEVTMVRPCDIDRGHGKVWTYRPECHKSEHHETERMIFIGPQAQTVLQPFLFRDAGAYLFSPRESMTEFRARQRDERKTKVQPSQQYRRKRKPRKQPGDRYTTDSYGQAVRKGCIKAGVAHWHPNQLRHSLATEVRRAAGIEAAKVILGRSAANTTGI